MGRAQGAINEKLMTSVIEPAYAKAEEDRAEVTREAKRFRRDAADAKAALDQAGRIGDVSWDPFGGIAW
jgi:hypothetical protein